MLKHDVIAGFQHMQDPTASFKNQPFQHSEIMTTQQYYQWPTVFNTANHGLHSSTVLVFGDALI